MDIEIFTVSCPVVDLSSLETQSPTEVHIQIWVVFELRELDGLDRLPGDEALVEVELDVLEVTMVVIAIHCISELSSGPVLEILSELRIIEIQEILNT